MKLCFYLLLAVLPGCIGARLGYRTGFNDTQYSGLYGGPWASFATAAADSAIIGVETSMMFAGENFGTIQPQLYAPLGWTDDFAVLAIFGLGFDFDPEGVSLHLSGCGQLFGVVNASACVRGSTRGWMGVDAGLGLPVLLLLHH